MPQGVGGMPAVSAGAQVQVSAISAPTAQRSAGDRSSSRARRFSRDEGVSPVVASAMSAIRHGRSAELEELLASGLNPNAVDAGGAALLSLACQNGHRRLARLLLRAGADVNAADGRGQTALHYSFAFGHFELSDYLISKGADDSATNAYGLTPYEGLVEGGND